MNITNDKLMEILERNLGLPMGDSGIFYIEDPGQKRINKIYFSKTNMSLYKCTADNTDVTVTGNFKLYSLSNTDDYLGALTGVDRGQVKYIQDVGTKYVDKVYIDRPTGKLYRCVTQTSSVNNDANFVENNLNSTDGKLQNLIEVIDVDGGWIKKYSSGIMELYVERLFAHAELYTFPISFYDTSYVAVFTRSKMSSATDFYYAHVNKQESTKSGMMIYLDGTINGSKSFSAIVTGRWKK